MPEPFTNYRKSLELAVNNIKTSHKADRSISGCLHEDTAYGLVQDNDKYNVAVRWTIDKFKEKKQYETIRDFELRNYACNDITKFKELVDNRGIRGIKVLKSENPLITIQDKFGKTYKAFAGGNNLCVEIYEVDGVRHAEVIQLFDAAQKGFKPRWMNQYSNGKLLMRLFKGDVIGYIENRIYNYFVVKGINFAANNLKLTSINSNTDEFRVGFNKLFGLDNNGLNAKQFNISVSGKVSKKKTADINFWNNKK